MNTLTVSSLGMLTIKIMRVLLLLITLICSSFAMCSNPALIIFTTAGTHTLTPDMYEGAAKLAIDIVGNGTCRRIVVDGNNESYYITIDTVPSVVDQHYQAHPIQPVHGSTLSAIRLSCALRPQLLKSYVLVGYCKDKPFMTSSLLENVSIIIVSVIAVILFGY